MAVLIFNTAIFLLKIINNHKNRCYLHSIFSKAIMNFYIFAVQNIYFLKNEKLRQA